MKLMRILLATAAVVATLSGSALAQGNPFDIRAREDAERAHSNYLNSLQNYDAARQRADEARRRAQMPPDPVPSPAINPTHDGPVQPGVSPDPALRLQQEDNARMLQWQADQAARDAAAAGQAAREAAAKAQAAKRRQQKQR